jgi:hypothetical protein
VNTSKNAGLSSFALSVFVGTIGTLAILGAIWSHADRRFATAIGLLLLGVAMLVKAWPRLLAEVHETEKSLHGALLYADELGAERERCACCGFRTITPTVESDSCSVCDWTAGEAAEVLSDGISLTLDTARQNFLLYRSIYSPGQKPSWSMSSPSDEEIAVRRQLTDLHRNVQKSGTGSFQQWQRIIDTETTLRHMVLDREANDQSSGSDAGR